MRFRREKAHTVVLPDGTAAICATPFKLRSGEWGARSPGDHRGETRVLLITARSGWTRRTEMTGFWSDGEATLWAPPVGADHDGGYG